MKTKEGRKKGKKEERAGKKKGREGRRKGKKNKERKIEMIFLLTLPKQNSSNEYNCIAFHVASKLQQLQV